MHAAIRELRKSRSGTRLKSLTLIPHNDVKTKFVAMSSNRQLTARFYSKWRLATGIDCAGNWSTSQPLAVASIAAIALVTSSDAMCDVRHPNGETEGARGDCNVCDDHDDRNSMSIYFDTEYELKKVLGCGTFGVVMQCAHKQTGRVSAVKMVHNIAGNQEEVEREKLALEQLERAGGHACIVGYERSYYHNDFHYVVLEYLPGTSLHSFVKNHRGLDTTLSLHLVSQLASALHFMHQENIVHRDLKPENIMALVNHDRNGHMVHANENNTEQVTLKIIDFGSAGRPSSPFESGEKVHPTTLSGTRCYWPPEVLQNHFMTTAMDMWALGCILYILISGRHPFDLMGCSTEDEVLQRAILEPVAFSLPVWHDVPAETKELIRGLLEKDPDHRLSAKQVLQHPAIAGVQTL